MDKKLIEVLDSDKQGLMKNINLTETSIGDSCYMCGGSCSCSCGRCGNCSCGSCSCTYAKTDETNESYKCRVDLDRKYKW